MPYPLAKRKSLKKLVSKNTIKIESFLRLFQNENHLIYEQEEEEEEEDVTDEYCA